MTDHFDPSDPFGISVIVVNWNSRDDLDTCLRSLAAQTERDFEVLVVDNGSTDGSIEMVRTRHPDAKLVEAGSNLGFAEGCNRGIAAARGAWLATLNNDADAEPEWIAELRAAAKAGDPRLGMLQSRIMLRRNKGHTNSTGLLLYASGYAEDRHFDQPIRPGEVTEEVFAASAGAALYRREMLDDVKLDSGFFDRTYFMYFEDVDLGWRARLAGWSSIYVPTAVVNHSFQGSSRRHGPYFEALLSKKNRLRTLLKNASVPFLIATLPWTLRDVVAAWVRIGPKAIPQLVSAAVDGARQRKVVTGLVRMRRREFERRWVTRREGSLR